MDMVSIVILILSPHTNSSNVLEAQCLIQLRRQQSEPYKQPWVIFAPIKKQRLKLLVEKCTKLGTQLFCPIMTDHTEAGAGGRHKLRY